jgi:hypothetical protein
MLMRATSGQVARRHVAPLFQGRMSGMRGREQQRRHSTPLLGGHAMNMHHTKGRNVAHRRLISSTHLPTLAIAPRPHASE